MSDNTILIKNALILNPKNSENKKQSLEEFLKGEIL